MSVFIRSFSGGGLFARALRGSAYTAGATLAAQVMRLGANLILTRLLFPEAFGMMALVGVFLVGLAMFSDVGLRASISASPQGDDPDFLNTAWTIQIIRGGVLWLFTCALALPAARLYDAPQLAQILPVAGLTLLISGFLPTRIETATRHLLLGRVMALDLLSQVISTIIVIGLAWAMQSVWALVISAIIGAFVKLWLTTRYLPGPANRLRWDPATARALIHFGKWIFLSTACGFLIMQGDKAILGAWLTLEQLGVYNIGFFLASFPILIAGAITDKILIPLYRDCPPRASAANFARLRRMRFMISLVILTMLGVMAFAGVPLVHFLYDERYAAAGAMVVVIACVQMPVVMGLTYDRAALAAGDSRGYFVVQAAVAAAQSAALLIGVQAGGLFGALVAQGIALLLVYPVVIWIARRHGAWDRAHDLVFALAAVLVGGSALWLHQAEIRGLAGV